jgi:hypothetical protein
LDAHAVLITSWNEWHEATELEPSREHGFEYLDLTRTLIGEYNGKTVEIQRSNAKVSVDPFTVNDAREVEGRIDIDIRNGAPLVIVDVRAEALDGADLVNLTFPQIAYYRNRTGPVDQAIIPYIGKSTSIDVSFTPTADESTILLSVHGYDPAGNEYFLFNGTRTATLPEPVPETGFETLGAIACTLAIWLVLRRAAS